MAQYAILSNNRKQDISKNEVNKVTQNWNNRKAR